jgi:streptogramin lyase
VRILVLAALTLLGSQPQVVARIQTGTGPGSATAAFGAVWVANDRAGTIVRIDPRTNRVTKRIRLRPGIFSLTHGFGALWVENYDRGTLTRVEPRTGRIRSIRLGGTLFDVLPAYGRIWATMWEAGTLVEIQPQTLRILHRTKVGPRPAGLRAAGGAVWLGFSRSATAVARIDPRTRAIERVDVGVKAPSGFATGTRDLWIRASDNVLVRLDPTSRRVLAKFSVGRTLAPGALAPDGTLWLPDKEQNVVYRVDPQAGSVVDSFPAGARAFAALRAFGSMWITSYAGSDVWRFAP